MFITNIRHLVNASKKMRDEMPEEARELAAFLPQVVEATTMILPYTLTSINIRCFKTGCDGRIKSAIRPDNEEIHWFCPVCENEGLINNWQRSRWDKRSKALQ